MILLRGRASSRGRLRFYRAPPMHGILASSISSGRFRTGRGRDCLQGLVHLRQRPRQSDSGIEMRAKAVDDILFSLVHPPRYRGKVGTPKSLVMSSAQMLSSKLAVVMNDLRDVWVIDALEVHGAPSQTVVPPQGDSVPLDQLEKPLKHGLFDDGTGGAPIGVGSGKQRDPGCGIRSSKRRRQIARLFGRSTTRAESIRSQRPPETVRGTQRAFCAATVVRLPLRVLPLAIAHASVRVNGRISKVRKRGADPRFGSVEDAAISLQRFGQRAHARLLDALSFAARTPPHSFLEEEPVVVHVREIVIG